MTFDPLDMIGREFGLLTVKEYIGRDGKGVATYRCACACGNPDLHTANRKNLLTGSPRSCGCLRRTRADYPEGTRMKYVTSEMKRQIAERGQTAQVPYKIVIHR